MIYEIRDRSDGMFELVFAKPVLVGIFPGRDGAEQYCVFLNDQDFDLPELEASSFKRAAEDVAELETDIILDDPVETPPPASPPVRKVARRAKLPAVIPDRPHPPAQLQVNDIVELTEEQTQQAFARIQQGEKIHAVATDFGLTMGQLRGRWANHKRHMQKHLAEGGQQGCKLCARPFTPSISHPDTCARCSK